MKAFNLLAGVSFALVAAMGFNAHAQTTTTTETTTTTAPATAPATTTAKKKRARVVPNAGAAPAAQEVAHPPAATSYEAPSAEVAHYTTGLKVNAFIDPEFRYANKDTSPGRGFTINDAALMLSKEFDQMKALVDLPFYSDTTGGTNRFVFADREAQAYLEINRWQNSTIRLGQYDSFFGVEANHSRDRFLANYGLLKTFFVPFTHTGAQYQYGKNEGLSVRGQITDSNGDGAMAQNNPEVAANVRYEGVGGYGALAASYNQAPNVPSDHITNALVELTGGLVQSKFRIDGEIDFKRTAGTDKNGLGVGVFATIPTGTLWAVGGRIEYAKDVYAIVPGVGAGAYDDMFSLSAGPSYKFTQDVTFRGDLRFDNYNAPGANSSLFGLNLSVVAQL